MSQPKPKAKVKEERWIHLFDEGGDKALQLFRTARLVTNIKEFVGPPSKALPVSAVTTSADVQPVPATSSGSSKQVWIMTNNSTFLQI